MTNIGGESTQIVEAVAELGDLKCTVSFIKTSDGVSILAVPEGVPSSPEASGAVSVILNDSEDITWD